jgi:hypothetical protein
MKFRGYLGIVFIGAAILALMAFGYTHLVGPGHANACSSGTPGGQGYVPQQRLSRGPSLPSGPSLTKAQAFDVVSSHIKKFNSNLIVGEIRDAGPYYDVEILSESKEVVERLAVDKQSGSLRSLQ